MISEVAVTADVGLKWHHLVILLKVEDLRLIVESRPYDELR